MSSVSRLRKNVSTTDCEDTRKARGFSLVAVCAIRVSLLRTCVVFVVFGCRSRLCGAQDMGKLYSEPQATASLRLGTMYHYGMVPFWGHNATEALA